VTAKHHGGKDFFMAIKSDRWIRRMALEYGMINPFNDRQVRDGVVSYGVLPTDTICAWPMNSKFSPTSIRRLSTLNILMRGLHYGAGGFSADSSELVRAGAVCRIFQNSPRRAHALRRQINVRSLWHYRERHGRLNLSGKALSRWKSPTPRRCRRRFIPMKGSARFCFSRAMSRVK